MNLIFDACSTINLHNGDLFETVLELTSLGFKFHMGTIVRGECGHLSSSIEKHVDNGRLTILPGKTLTASQFSRILNRYQLGLGETECIAHAERMVLIVCSDDKPARRAAEDHLGAGRALGSLALLRKCVCSGKVSPNCAYLGYELMKTKGAFLPDIPSSYFDP